MPPLSNLIFGQEETAYQGTMQAQRARGFPFLQKEADHAAWREQAQMLDASKLVFLDECGSNIALTRLYARSPKGKRA